MAYIVWPLETKWELSYMATKDRMETEQQDTVVALTQSQQTGNIQQPQTARWDEAFAFALWFSISIQTEAVPIMEAILFCGLHRNRGEVCGMAASSGQGG